MFSMEFLRNYDSRGLLRPVSWVVIPSEAMYVTICC